MIFKTLVECILKKHRDPDNGLAINALNTITREIKTDLTEAFLISRPLVDRHSSLFWESKSYFDFLMKISQLPSIADFSNRTAYSEPLRTCTSNENTEENESLTCQLNTCKNKLKTCENELATRKQAFKTERETFQSKIKQLEAALDECEQSLDKLNSEKQCYETIKNKFENLKEERETFKYKSKALEAELKSCKENLERLQSEKKQWKSKEDSLNQRLSKHRLSLVQTEEEKTQLKLAMNQYREMEDQRKANNLSIERCPSDLQRQLTEEIEKNNQLTQQLMSVWDRMNQLELYNKELKDILLDFQNKYEISEHKNEALMTELLNTLQKTEILNAAKEDLIKVIAQDREIFKKLLSTGPPELTTSLSTSPISAAEATCPASAASLNESTSVSALPSSNPIPALVGSSDSPEDGGIKRLISKSSCPKVNLNDDDDSSVSSMDVAENEIMNYLKERYSCLAPSSEDSFEKNILELLRQDLNSIESLKEELAALRDASMEPTAESDIALFVQDQYPECKDKPDSTDCFLLKLKEDIELSNQFKEQISKWKKEAGLAVVNPNRFSEHVLQLYHDNTLLTKIAKASNLPPAPKSINKIVNRLKGYNKLVSFCPWIDDDDTEKESLRMLCADLKFLRDTMNNSLPEDERSKETETWFKKFMSWFIKIHIHYTEWHDFIIELKDMMSPLINEQEADWKILFQNKFRELLNCEESLGAWKRNYKKWLDELHLDPKLPEEQFLEKLSDILLLKEKPQQKSDETCPPSKSGEVQWTRLYHAWLNLLKIDEKTPKELFADKLMDIATRLDKEDWNYAEMENLIFYLYKEFFTLKYKYLRGVLPIADLGEKLKIKLTFINQIDPKTERPSELFEIYERYVKHDLSMLTGEPMPFESFTDVSDLLSESMKETEKHIQNLFESSEKEIRLTSHGSVLEKKALKRSLSTEDLGSQKRSGTDKKAFQEYNYTLRSSRRRHRSRSKHRSVSRSSSSGSSSPSRSRHRTISRSRRSRKTDYKKHVGNQV